MNWKSCRFKSVAAIAALVGLALLCGADEPAREYKVKAAFIYNFAQFVAWPDSAFSSPDAPFVVAVIGQDPFNGILEQVVAGKKVGARQVVVRHFNAVEQIGRCQILFVPMTEVDSMGKIIQKVENSPVLTIGETESFSMVGGCFRFFTEDNKMRFEINQDATDLAGLRISSKLLKLARLFKN